MTLRPKPRTAPGREPWPYGWYLELTEMVNAKEVLAGNLPPSDLGVRAVDDHTLEVKLNTPLPYFPAMTTYATLFPAHRATIEAHGADWTAPGNMVSNGAYVLEELVTKPRLSSTCSSPPTDRTTAGTRTPRWTS